MNKVSTFVMGAAIGCAAGALAALALSPQSGKQNIEFVTERAGAVFESAQSKAGAIVGGAGQAASNEMDDDLREKIEAARERIAAQIAQEAEEEAAVAGA